MDANLVAATVAALAPALPYLLKASETAAEEAAKEVGKGAWDCAKAIWTRLWPKVQAKNTAREAAEDVAKTPGDEDARAALRVQLKKLLAEDGSLAAEIERLLEEGRKAGAIVVASGVRSVAIGGSISGATIVTGDQNKLGGK